MRAIIFITLFFVFSYKLFCQNSTPKVNKTHKNFKFGTYVLVRNLKNDSTVIVKINDRLPQNSKRTIDLSLKAAKQLNFIKSGITKVEITVLDSPTK